jgi:spore coat polysaccharide biosynthesis protein SpsF
VAIIQARMGSTRLPGKVLIDLAGEPMLARVVRRVQRARTLHAVMVATTVEPADDPIVELCAARGWPCSRGSQDDVLERYYQAALAALADVVVRITSDCPLIEPVVVDHVVEEFLAGQPGIDYACNWLPARTFPRGLDTEVFSFAALDRARREDQNPAWREHVTPYIYRHPELFCIHGVANAVDLSDLRWTVDTQEDLAFAGRIYDWFENDAFSWQDVLAVLQQHPEWREINRHVEQKVV